MHTQRYSEYVYVKASWFECMVTTWSAGDGLSRLRVRPPRNCGAQGKVGWQMPVVQNCSVREHSAGWTTSSLYRTSRASEASTYDHT